MKIYIASKTRHADKWRKLRAKGVDVISTWIYDTDQYEAVERADLAQRCIAEATACEAMLVYYEVGEHFKGGFIEIGVALAAGKPIYAVGECLPETSVFRSHPLWRQCGTLGEAMEAMKDVPKQITAEKIYDSMQARKEN